MGRRHIVVLWSGFLALAISGSCLAWGGSDEPETLKSLKGREPEVRVSEPEPVSSSQKLEAYNDFLALAEAGDDSSLRVEAMRRQADLYMELGEEASLRNDGLLKDDPNQLRAIEIYNQIRKEYPNYEQLEFVVYQLSKAYENVGNQAEVLASLNEIVTAIST